MKLGIVGKGGVGKTTTSALIAQAYAARGAQVVAIDTDSNPNLGMSLGLGWEEMEAVPVMPRALIVGSDGDMTAQEVIDKYGRQTPAGPILLSAIRVAQAGAGCTCSGHATVRNFLGEVLAEQADVTLIDMEAGLEHLSRSGGTLAYADVLLVVMEPSRKSVITAARTMALAEELGIPRVYGLGNKARLPEDARFFADMAAEYKVPLAGVIPLDPAVTEADRSGSAVTASPPEAVRSALDAVIDFIEKEPVESQPVG
ncbi:MAG TPA: AAA family ATPase [Egibacteraceae bacterium]|nr:AAA family ATPase [Egibacteraceae bacterium]